MNLIEQAARRLEELRRSGVEVPTPRTDANSDATMPSKAWRKNGSAAEGNARVRGRRFDGADPAPEPQTVKHVEIDLERLATMGYLTPKSHRARIADEFRVLKRPILNNVHGKSAAPADRANLVMVTSSLPGEGKTFSSINLAISMSMEVDTRVLLVDADVARPAILDRLGLPPSPGLLDLLTDTKLGVSDVLMKTNIERLMLLPSGAHQNHATELLASEGMSALLDELSTRYADRIIVFDAPPLLVSTESRVLANRMGQVVVIVEAERTSQHSVAQAMAELESCPIVLPVLNKSTNVHAGSYYGSYGTKYDE